MGNNTGVSVSLNSNFRRFSIIGAMVALLMLPGFTHAMSLGVGGAQDSDGDGVNDISDVAKEGCLCHAANATNSVQIVLDDVPYTWVAGEIYEMKLQLIGGPVADTSSTTGGFSMRVSAGSLEENSLVQNWDDDVMTLTHNGDGGETADRMWVITWNAPESGEGVVEFWITGNSVDGNGVPAGGDDAWNQLTFPLKESDEDSGLGTRTLFAGDGNVSAPEPEDHGVDLHHMGAPFRAHWLGLLGFLSVILVIIFAGLLLRYGFSTSYKGRSNLLRLRYKINRRGDQ